jgi:ribokinase
LNKRIVVVGSSNTDMIVRIPRIPRPGETVTGGEFSIASGGKGANQAVAAARAGGDVELIARVGNDLFGKQAIDGFSLNGIKTDHIVRDRETASGVALIFVDRQGETSIAVVAGANMKLNANDIEAAEKSIASANILLLQLEIPQETVKMAVKIAARHRMIVILNPAPWNPVDDELLRQITIVTPNKTEAEMMSGVKIESESDLASAAKIIQSRGVESVLITLGVRGAFLLGYGLRELIPAFKVQVVDTTAAGDVFNGALSVALAEEKPIREAVRFANAAAALAVTRMGAQPSAPFRNEIDEFLRTSIADAG